jgi:peptidoglycan biosynthesis protein MviN/MurJ (putative lipid II flippase)
LYFLMRSHLGRLESRAMLTLLVKVALASIVLLAVCAAGAHFLLADWAVQPFWPKCLRLLLVIAAGAAAFFVSANALAIAEVHDIRAALQRRLARAATNRRG